MAEQTIDQLNIEINAKAKQGSSGMEKLISIIEKLKVITGGSTGELTGLAASIQDLKSVLTGVKGQSGTVSSLANSINKLNDAKTERISGNLNTLTTSLKTLGGMDSGLKTIISDLAELSRSGGGSTAMNALKLQAQAAKTQAVVDKSALSSAKSQEGLKAIADKNNQIAESAKWAAEAQESLAKAVERAAKTGYSGEVSKYIPKSVLPDTGKSAPYVGLSTTASSLGDLRAIVGESQKVTGEGQKTTGILGRISNAFKSAAANANNFNDSARKAFRMQNFYGGYFIARRIASTLGGFINNINEYVENMNLFSVAMGDSADEGERLANSLQNVLGIDAGEASRYMGIFRQLETSFGTTDKQATIVSKNLTQLGYDIASFFNLSTDQAFLKLQSGIAGEIEPLRRIGIDISKVRLQQELLQMGIKEKYENLSQADKSLLRYKAILEQTINAQGDMARTLDTPANQIRVLTAQMQIAGRAIGSVFIPALNAILPPAIAVVEIIGELASQLAAFIGFTMPKIDYSSVGSGISGISDDADGAANGIGDIGKNAKDAKKEIDGMIGGFDELNVIDKKSGSKGSGGAGGNILGDMKLPQYDALAGAVGNKIDAIKEKLEKYKPMMAEIFKLALSIGTAFLTWKLSNALFAGLITLVPSLASAAGLFLQISAGLAVVAGLFTFAYTHSETFRKGLDAVGDGIKWLGERFNKFSDESKANGEFWTSYLAGLTITLGVVAVLLGAPVFGAFLIVGGAVVLALQAIGRTASDSIEPVNLYGKGISETTEKKVKPFIEQMDKLDETIKSIKWSGRIVTSSDVDSVKAQVKQISTTIINELDADKNDALKKLDPLRGMLNSTTYTEIVQANQKHYDTLKTSVSDGETRINEIMQNAKNEHRGIKQSEYDEISKIEANMKSTGIKYLSESQTESNLIFQNLKDNHTALSAQEAAEIVKNSVQTKNQTIDNAKKQYDGIMTETQRMYDVGAINKEQYDKIRDAATLAKSDTIKQAEEQHSKIVEEAKKQSGDLSKEIDWSTGDIKSKWTVFWEDVQKNFSDGWTNVRTFFQVSIPEWWNKDISPWFTIEKWNGISDNIKTSVSGKWLETTKWWNSLGPVKWFKEDVQPWFTAEKWMGMMNKVPDAFKLTFKNAVNGGIEIFNRFIDWINEKMHFKWDAVKVGGKTIVGAGKIQLFTVPKIPQLASGNVAYGPLVAQFGEYPNASTNPEITAPQSIIRETVESSNEGTISAIYAMAEAIVQAIKEKETTVEVDGKTLAQTVNQTNSNKGYNLGLQLA